MTVSLLKHREFRVFWAAQTASMLGGNMSRVAIPLLAATTLAAGPLEMGLLQAAQTVAFLLVGLPAGALVDRTRRRPVLIACDVLRAALMGLIVLGLLLDRMNFPALIAVTFAIGLATVFFEIAYQSYVPSVVAPERLVEANARLEGTSATARTAGPTLGGSMVQLAGAALTVAGQAAAHAVSAWLLSRLRVVEPDPEHSGERRLMAEVGTGLRFVLGHPVFRALIGSAATFNFFFALTQPLVMLLLVDELALSGATVGLLMAAGGVGGVLGAACAVRIAAWCGQVRAMWLAYLVTMPTTLLIPFAQGGWGVALFAAPWFASGFGIVVFNVGQVSIRQALCPPELLGRMNASVRFIVWGVLPFGSFAGGVLGEWVGLRGGLLVASFGMTSGVVWLLCSSLVRMRDLPRPAGREAPAGPAEELSPAAT
ncbi:MFS transporter [Streptomyces sp. NPDC045251]|uniref:MFS transporter n=1 Tax=unclassified Streptomyces TaxID=2593676 RepID=UPI0033D640DE